MQQRMHLIQILFNCPTSHTMMAWTDAGDRQFEGMSDIAYWQDIARTLEAACFDGVFFADTPAAHDQYRDSPLASVRHGVGWPTHDPMMVVAVMAAATERLGFGVTLSTSGTPPYLAVRRISSLDYLTRGRIGWNVVTGHLRSEHRALGHEQLGHDERYEHADEYMEICNRLWDSVPPEAVRADRSSGVLVDTDKVSVVDYQGRYLSCHAVSPTIPSRQGRPVIFQAGQSPRGMEFAIKHAEVVFAIQPTLEHMKAFTAKVAEAAAAARKPAPGVLYGIQPIIADSEEEALARRDELEKRIPIDAAFSRMSGTLGIDFSKFDPNQPLEDMDTKASRGMMAAYAGGGKGRTLAEIARRAGVSAGIPQIFGTPTSIADQLEHIWRESGGLGFNLSPTTNPDSVRRFATEVVPLLQQRGIFRTRYTGSTLREVLGEA